MPEDDQRVLNKNRYTTARQERSQTRYYKRSVAVSKTDILLKRWFS